MATDTTAPTTPTRVSGKLEMAVTALDAIMHGAGMAGNTQLLRTQEIIRADGTPARVPFISGNSFKHMIRSGGAHFALEAMGVEPGTLSKAVIDLLFSGGHLSSKAGAAVSLERARTLCDLFPILAICGFSAGNTMIASKIRVDNLHLACQENAWRMPEHIEELVSARHRAGALRGEEFGTRHEAIKSPKVAAYLPEAKQRQMAIEAGAKLSAKQAGAAAQAKADDTSQMIYEMQVLKPGSELWGCIYMVSLSEMEIAALSSALSYGCEGELGDGLIYRLGAASSVGWGRVRIRFSGSIREDIRAPGYVPSDEVLPIKASGHQSARDAYVSHLREHREEIVSALEGAMK